MQDILSNLAKELFEIKKNDPNLYSDIFQDKCKEFCSVVATNSLSEVEAVKFFDKDEDIKKYLEAMFASLSWKDFKTKYKDFLSSKKS